MKAYGTIDLDERRKAEVVIYYIATEGYEADYYDPACPTEYDIMRVGILHVFTDAWSVSYNRLNELGVTKVFQDLIDYSDEQLYNICEEDYVSDNRF